MARVLVVDDDTMILRVMWRVLPDHDVAGAQTVEQVLARLGRGELFDAIFVDLSLPALTGMALHEELLRRFPAAARRLIFMTGGAASSQADAFVRSLPNVRLDKPFGSREVAAALQSSLDSNDRP
jgi:CheY-like chemotaxis protein